MKEFFQYLRNMLAKLTYGEYEVSIPRESGASFYIDVQWYFFPSSVGVLFSRTTDALCKPPKNVQMYSSKLEAEDAVKALNPECENFKVISYTGVASSVG